jgi:competence protein ComEA
MKGGLSVRQVAAAGLALVGLFFAGHVGASCAQRPRPGELTLETASPEAGPGEAVVHVAGAVRSPGVYALPDRARVIDAIQKAGGFAPNADPGQLNLAARVVDGTQILVPLRGAAPAPGAPQRPAARGAAPAAAGGLVSINSASAEELDTLPGIGPATAAKIIEYRQRHGGFKTVDELAAVKGIGPKKLERLRPRVTL